VWGRREFWLYAEQKSGFVGTALEFLLPWLLQACVTLAVFQYLKKDKVSVLQSFGTGLARFFYAFGVGLVLLIFYIVLAFFIGMIAVTLVTSGMVGGAILVGVVMFVVLVWMNTMFLIAPQAAVVERVGPFKALARSAGLTSGARWKVLGIVLLIGILQFGFVWILQSIVFDVPASKSEAQTAVVIITVVSAILSAFQAVVAAVIYHDLRKAKEGVGVDELLQVFA
jgi:hypothetical protein